MEWVDIFNIVGGILVVICVVTFVVCFIDERKAKKGE